MENNILNVILGLLTILSFIWSYISEENRVIAIVIGFLLIVLILFSEKNERLNVLSQNQTRLEEKLKIHEQFIDIKSDIKELQKNVFRK